MSIRCTVESAFFIAWTCLEQSGELGPPDETANFILDAIEAQLRTGERRPLMLANRAIDAYRRQRAQSRLSAERQIRLG
ncbi:hypothetical protein I3J27_16645 [Bradyrhizobium xenonodulans]|uniref:Uncharacterized protein n=1 Tax=Bradyrhizobium xenonodulans TaxID=2736875 RepID=A0ABY7MU86_9BRAD|nr:hypothetical protein [Bradyrhizobium xenonodulans]WBL81968.1 hypothetical protein I3J27_16645 [Bradyrhizobium xenonodulans]